MRKLTAVVLMLLLSVTVNGFCETPQNDTLKTIFNRKSVRHYKEGKVTDEQLLTLVKAGMAAPTAVDKRPWEFIVITDKATLVKLAENLPYAKMVANAAAAIVVCGDTAKQFGGKDSQFWIMDCSAATENILLAAESLGLGAVWTAVYPGAERIKPVTEILNIPVDKNIVPLALIPVGVPVGDEKPKDKYNPDQIHHEKW